MYDRPTGPLIPKTGLDDVVIVVNTSLNDKKNTFGFAEGTATQAFELPNQSGISKRPVLHAVLLISNGSLRPEPKK